MYAFDATSDLSSLLTTNGPVRLHADQGGQVDVGNVSLPGLTRIDCYNNGQRVGGTPEVLYITGIGGAPELEIASNATLVLNDIETYNWDGTQWVHLNALFGPSDRCISYAGGQLCIGVCNADFNRDGNLDFFDVQEFLGDFSAGCP
ncbi:MAG: hypothetical protein DYG94_12875 [Leptolyngbya sp. PLA3]|nr:MAG: hypothetical protein EDM82_12275 [Cyanobacteria bacterium CYA]MCE7969618.1 hypothetical protein [Leptolyngbya sp. PL-A3]